MYTNYFGFSEAPFSIAPNPFFLYLSACHREALAHLLYGVQSNGAFILLTGEVGTGKTTVCRALLQQLPDDVDTAFVLNPGLGAADLLSAICDDLQIDRPDSNNLHRLTDVLYRHLLRQQAADRHTLVIIDEAQNLAPEVLEQLRLLTNLETTDAKLLQIILLGQPELLHTLARPELRQLAQRITARFHLRSLDRNETAAYVRHRLTVAGGHGNLFDQAALERIWRESRGIPRLISLICDRALLGTFAEDRLSVDARTVRQAAAEVRGDTTPRSGHAPLLAATGIIAAALLTALVWLNPWQPAPAPTINTAIATPAKPPANMTETPPATHPKDQHDSDANMTTPATDTPPTDEQDNTETAPTSPTSKTDSLMTALLSGPIATAELTFPALVAHWQADATATTCEEIQTLGLRCLTRSGPIAELRGFNRPALLELQADVMDTPSHGVATKVKDNIWTISLNNNALHIEEAELLRLWNGRYTILWRPPPGFSGPSRFGDSGRQVDRLDERLRLVLNEPGSPTDRFDALLERRVRTFQIAVGLVPDGIAGAQTWVHLNNRLPTRIPTPTLQADHSATTGQNNRSGED